MSNPFASSVQDNYNPFAAGTGFNSYQDADPNSPFSQTNPTPAAEPSYNNDSGYAAYNPPEDTGYQPYTPPDSGYQPYTPPSAGYSAPPAAPENTGFKPSISPNEANDFKTSMGISNGNPFKAATGSGGATFKDPVTGVSVSEADLSRRESELAKREANIASKEQAIANGTYQKPVSRKNFPPLIKMWEYYPNEELPASSVTMVQLLKWCYLGHVLSLFINCITSFFLLAPKVGERIDSPATQIILSCIYFIVFCPLSFEISFFIIYRALRDGKAVRFFCGLATWFIWWAFLVFSVIGINDTGCNGFVIMIDIFGAEENKWVGAVSLIFCIVGTLTCLAHVFVFIKFIRYYKSEGLAHKAVAEAGQMAADYAKEHPEVAKEVATTAVQNGLV